MYLAMGFTQEMHRDGTSYFTKGKIYKYQILSTPYPYLPLKCVHPVFELKLACSLNQSSTAPPDLNPLQTDLQPAKISAHARVSENNGLWLGASSVLDNGVYKTQYLKYIP